MKKIADLFTLSLSLEEEGANVAVSVVFGAEEEGNKFLFYIIKKQIK